MTISRYREHGMTYDDVLIMPQYSDIITRADIDVRTKFLGDYRLPIVSAPMDTVSGPGMVCALQKCGAYGILHRFDTPNNLAKNVYDVRKNNLSYQFGVSIGVKDWEATREWLDYVAPADIHSICIDVAHGHHALVGETITNVREWSNSKGINPEIIAGNIATAEGFRFLAQSGATAVRVGIGPGAACTTRETTGIGIPQLTALRDVIFERADTEMEDVAIIADGGIKTPGDIAKALAVGADAVMLGRMLAGADEASGIVRYGKKQYRGQSVTGSNGARGAPEGISGWVDQTGPVKDTIDQLVHYLRSSFSYVGARNIDEFRSNATFIRVSPATTLETKTRL